jgi:hypothetical protein
MNKNLFLAISGFFFLLFLALDLFLYRPGANELRHLNAEIVQSRNQALGSQIPSDQLMKIRGLIEQNIVRPGAGSGGEDQTSETLGRLMAALKELDIELLSITPGETKQDQLMVTSPFEMELRCDYHQLLSLFEAIERSPDLIKTTGFELIKVQNEVVVNLSAVIYMFLEVKQT